MPTYVANNNEFDETEIQKAIDDFSANVDIENKATFIAYKNEKDDIAVSEFSPEITESLTYTPGDGVLEYAVFHIGFNNWKNTTGDLYYTITCDELLKTVAGTAYVKEKNLLFPETYYEDKWYDTLNPATTTATRILKSNIYVGNVTEVKVGFKNVTFTTLADRGGSFSNEKNCKKNICIVADCRKPHFHL